MDMSDFSDEGFNNKEGNTLYPTIPDLLREIPCAEYCGIVEVEIKLKKVIQEPNDEL